MLFAADELFSFLRDFGEVFLTGGEKGMHLAGFKLACFVSPCWGGWKEVHMPL